MLIPENRISFTFIVLYPIPGRAYLVSYSYVVYVYPKFMCLHFMD